MTRKILILLLPLTLFAGCGNPQYGVADVRAGDESVRYANTHQPTPPVCENEDQRHVDVGVRVTCIWTCKNFWTSLRGAGRYDVAITWVWDFENQYYEPSSLNAEAGSNTYPFWAAACDPLPVTNCPECEF